MSVVDDIRAGKAQIEWAEVVSKSADASVEIRVPVIRDALKIDGVRVSASAQDLQRIADMLGCLLLTPKIIDLIYQQAKLRFEPVVNIDGRIVAKTSSKAYSAAIDAKIREHGGDPGGLIDSVGKYWVLHNHLSQPAYLKLGSATVCNYGWLSSSGAYAAVTHGLRCWQNPGFQHDDVYDDPSQLIRLMRRWGWIVTPGEPPKPLDIAAALRDPKLAPLLNHDGVLTYLRVAAVEDSPPADPPAISSYAPEASSLIA